MISINKKNRLLSICLLVLSSFTLSYASYHKTKKRSYGCTEKVKRLFIYSLLGSSAVIQNVIAADLQEKRMCNTCSESTSLTRYRFQSIEADIANKDIFLDEHAACINSENGYLDRYCEKHSAELQLMLEGLHACKCPNEEGLLKSVENLLRRLRIRFFNRKNPDQAEAQADKYINWIKENAGYVQKKPLK